jgi:hypothetical protein
LKPQWLYISCIITFAIFIKVMPALEGGIADQAWSLEEIIDT